MRAQAEIKLLAPTFVQGVLFISLLSCRGIINSRQDLKGGEHSKKTVYTSIRYKTDR